MTRGEFMSGMLEYVFGVKYIEFSRSKNSLLEYTKGEVSARTAHILLSIRIV